MSRIPTYMLMIIITCSCFTTLRFRNLISYFNFFFWNDEKEDVNRASLHSRVPRISEFWLQVLVFGTFSRLSDECSVLLVSRARETTWRNDKQGKLYPHPRHFQMPGARQWRQPSGTDRIEELSRSNLLCNLSSRWSTRLHGIILPVATSIADLQCEKDRLPVFVSRKLKETDRENS